MAAPPAEALGWLEWAFAAYGVLVYEDAFLAAFRLYLNPEQQTPGQSDISSTISQILMLVGLAPCLWKYRDRVAVACRDALPVLLVVGLCALSALWADYQVISLRRSANLATCVMFGVYLYCALGFDRTVRVIAYCAVAAAIGSVILYATVPAIGQETDPLLVGTMRGVFPQKNKCADAMLLGIICWIYLGAVEPRRWLKSISAIVLLFGSILLARSATAAVLGVLVIVLGVMYAPGRNAGLRMMLGFILIFAIAATIVAALADPVGTFGLLDRDPTLTGRIPLWGMVLSAIAQRPLLGYGFGSFWNADSVTVQYIWQVINWYAPTAHCGYLDVLLQLGVAGLALYVWILGAIIRLLWQAVRSDPSPMITWLVLFVLIVLTLNIDEGPLPSPDLLGALTPFCLVYLRQWQRRWERENPIVRLSQVPVVLRMATRRQTVN